MSAPVPLATRDDQTGILTLEELQTKPRFLQFEIGIGWANPLEKGDGIQHWAIALGEREDHGLIFIQESAGNLHEVAEDLIVWKDRLLVKRIHADGTSQPGCMRYLRSKECDGLTQYASTGQDRFGREQWIHPPEFWPSYRDPSVLASLVPVPDRIRGDIYAGFEVLVKQVENRSTTATPECARLTSLLAAPPNEIIEHPLIRAAVWVHAAVCMARSLEELQGRKAASFEPIYSNPTWRGR